MSQNRLKLDWSLNYVDERVNFVNNYINNSIFVAKPPTDDELEMMSNYVLWGKDRNTGLNMKQEKLIDLPSRNGDWAANKCESLDEMMESPTFNEVALLNSAHSPSTIVRREVFSRDEALRKCPESMRDSFISLFREIDECELKINFYELKHGKREKPPRESLMKQFGDDELRRMREAIDHWNQFHYLKQRHTLVELRRQQYTLKDSYVFTIPSMGSDTIIIPAEAPDFDAGIEVLPLGAWHKHNSREIWFRDWDKMVPGLYTEEELVLLSKHYWTKHDFHPTGQELYFDFRNLEHVY